MGKYERTLKIQLDHNSLILFFTSKRCQPETDS